MDRGRRPHPWRLLDRLGIFVATVAILGSAVVPASLLGASTGLHASLEGDVDPLRAVAADFAVEVRKSVATVGGDPAGATARPGDRLRYTVSIANTGAIAVRRILATDPIPETTRYVPGSLRIVAGHGAGSVSDALDDGDGGGFDPTVGAAGSVRVLLGRRDAEGLLEAGEAVTFEFEVDVLPTVSAGSRIANRARLSLERIDEDEASIHHSNRVETVVRTEDTAASKLTFVKSVRNLDSDPTGRTGFRGDRLLYTVRLTNDGPADILEVTGVDVVPGWGRFVPGSLEITAGPWTGTLTDALDDGDLGGFDPTDGPSGAVQVRLGVIEDWGLIRPGETAEFRFRVRIREDAPIDSLLINRGVARYESAAHEPLVERTNRVTTRVIGRPHFADVSVLLERRTKDTVPVGSLVEYEVTTRNQGPAVAFDVAVADTLPAGAELVAASRGGRLVDGVVVWPTLARLDVTDEQVDVVALRFPVAGPQRSIATAVSGAPVDPDPTNNLDVDILVVRPDEPPVEMPADSVDVAVSMIGDDGPFVRGTRGTYTIHVRNEGPDTAVAMTLLVVSSTGLEGLDFEAGGLWSLASANAQVEEGSQSAGLHLQYGASLPPGMEAEPLVVTADVASDAPDPVFIEARVREPGDVRTDNDRRRKETPVTSVDLALAKIPVGPFVAGGAGSFRIEVTNNGTAATVGPITVVDELPEVLSYRSFEGEGWDVEDVGGRVEAIYAPGLDPGQTSTLVLEVDVTSDPPLGAGGEPICAFRNAVVGWTVGDSLPDVNRAETETVSFACAPALALVKTTARPEAERTELVPYRLVVSNTGRQELHDVQVTDVLPMGFEYRSSGRSEHKLLEPPGGRPAVLVYDIGDLAVGAADTIDYTVVVGLGAPVGLARNVARAEDLSTGTRSPDAVAEVTVREGAFSDEGLVLGKVSADCPSCRTPALPGDPALGIPGVRVYLQDGTSAVTDEEGEFNFYGLRPRSWVVRVDPATLPAGLRLDRLTNRHSDDGLTLFVDLTRGELARADFRASVDSTEVAQWDSTVARRLSTRGFDALDEGRERRVGPDRPFRPLASHDLVDAGSPVDSRAPADLDQAMDGSEPPDDAPAAGSSPPGTPPEASRGLALGVLEARLDIRSLADGDLVVRRNAFEDELTRLSVESDDGRTTAGARLAAFAKGPLTEDGRTTYLLSLDSEDDPDKRFFRDIEPEDFYGLYGDGSVKRYEAQSRGRFFGRVERGSSHLQWGDFTTAWANDQSQQLGRYVRTLSGISQRYETQRVRVNGFASRERFGHIVDEFPGMGISGPYELTRRDGLINSERVEIVTRDRNQRSRIIRTVVLERFLDYSIEPFTGRLLLKAPVPSLDEDLNPVFIRVVYEAEETDDAFWVLGADARVQATSFVELGGGFARDNSPAHPYDLASANATIRLSPSTFVVGEWARSEADDLQTGAAGRVELQHRSADLLARAFFLRSDSTFSNASAGYGPSRPSLTGREDAGLSLRGRVGEGTSLFLEALRTESLRNDDRRRGIHLGVEQRLRQAWSVAVGYRWAESTTTGVQDGPWDLSTAMGRVTRHFGGGATPGRTFVEYEQDLTRASRRRLLLGGDVTLQVAGRRARLYGRHELISSLDGPYALNDFEERNSTAIGVAGEVPGAGQVYSEYRIRDAFSGREAQAAIGLRNRWLLKDGVALSTGFERVDPLSADRGRALAVTGGLEYRVDPLWRGTLRGEFRASDRDDQFLGSFGYARKLSRDLSLLGHSVVSHILDGPTYARTRVGLAFRNTIGNAFNALARYEHRYESRPEVGPDAFRAAHLVSSHATLSPVPSLTLRGQYVGKWAEEQTAPGVAINDPANLVGLRATLDITPRWDVGATVRSLGLGTALPVGSVASREWGVGAEVGLRLGDGLRMAVGYNAFGFTDEDLTAGVPTDRGPYIDLSWTFDDALLRGLWGDDGESGSARGPSPAVSPSTCPGWACPDLTQTPAERLTPLRARISDRSIAADLATIEWRQGALDAMPSPEGDAARHRYARARAWLEVARVEYQDVDTTGIAAYALERVDADLAALRGLASGDSLAIEPVVPPGVDPDSPEWGYLLWLTNHPCIIPVPAPLARAEVRLAWAANEVRTLSGAAGLHVDMARRHLAESYDGLETCPPSEVERFDTAGEPALRYPVPDRVHFALGRHDLSPRSRSALDWIGWVLNNAGVDSVRVVLRGLADATGPGGFNETLILNRADTVRSYLRALVPRARVAFVAVPRGGEAGFDPLPPVWEETSPLDRARNRRVDIRLESDAAGETRFAPFEHLLDLQMGQPWMTRADTIGVTVGAAVELGAHGVPQAGLALLEPWRLGSLESRTDSLARIDVHTALMGLSGYAGAIPRDSLHVRMAPGGTTADLIRVSDHRLALSIANVAAGRLTDAERLRDSVRAELEGWPVPPGEVGTWIQGLLETRIGTARFSVGSVADAIVAYENAVFLLRSNAGAPVVPTNPAGRLYRARQDTIRSVEYSLAELYMANGDPAAAVALHTSVLDSLPPSADELERIRVHNSLGVALEVLADTLGSAAPDTLATAATAHYARALAIADAQVGSDRFMRGLVAFNPVRLDLASTDSATIVARLALDQDLDSVPNPQDALACGDTPFGARVGPDGCQLDADGDRVPDFSDRCAATRWGALVNRFGCGIDGDWDFVPEPDMSLYPDLSPDAVPAGLDRCPGDPPPRGAMVDRFGCLRPEDLSDERGGPGRETPSDPASDSLVVSFPYDSAEIDAAQIVEIRALRDRLTPLIGADGFRLEVRGHASPEGPEGYNETLSAARTEAVRFQLALAFPGTPIDTVSLGERRPLAIPDSLARMTNAQDSASVVREWLARNRRAVIHWRRVGQRNDLPPTPARAMPAHPVGQRQGTGAVSSRAHTRSRSR